MDFEPQKFFVGLMDFFSILLPGALLTFLLMDKVGPAVLGPERYHGLDGAAAWAAFVVASYMLGHLVFLLGSWLDEVYDWARGRTLDAQIAMLARRGRLPPWPARVLIWLAFRSERNRAVERAAAIKRQALAPLRAGDAVNTFQWSKALLTLKSPASLAVVQRFEADSKFFRCFAIVLLVLLAAWPIRPWPLEALPVIALLMLLALWRYMEQRLKATNQAYWAVITLVANGGEVALGEPAAAAVPDRAGGVVFRLRGGKAQYLLVEARDRPGQWVLPKGHVAEGEAHGETAVREVREEAGVWARIVRALGDTSYTLDGAGVSVRFFLMQAVGRGLREDPRRQRAWLPLKRAVARANHIETAELLRAAEQRRTRKAR